MKDIVTLPDSSIARETRQLLVAIKFLKNKKRNFESVVRLCEKAALFQNIDSQYLAAFSRDREGVRLAMAVLEEMRLASWKMIVFADGDVLTRVNKVRNVVDCASGCYRAANKTAYCVKERDEPMDAYAERGAFTFSLDDDGERLPEEHLWRLPCKLLDPDLSLSKSEIAKPQAKIEALAAERLVSVCPHFEMSRFEILEKPKRVTRPKRYW